MEIQYTGDGSHTLYIPEMDEHYHSVNGAIRESMHIFIEAGLNSCIKEKIRVLELGFGTGLNALLTCMEAGKKKLTIEYTSIEKYPLPESVFRQLNYAQLLSSTDYTDIFLQMHQSEWNKTIEILPGFFLRKLHADFTNHPIDSGYDVIYYDAFAPDKQPQAWSQDIFNRLYDCMNENGILTTYCAKGIVRRMMLSAGFSVERLPGPPGKREMLRAVK